MINSKHLLEVSKYNSLQNLLDFLHSAMRLALCTGNSCSGTKKPDAGRSVLAFTAKLKKPSDTFAEVGVVRLISNHWPSFVSVANDIMHCHNHTVH